MLYDANLGNVASHSGHIPLVVQRGKYSSGRSWIRRGERPPFVACKGARRQVAEDQSGGRSPHSKTIRRSLAFPIPLAKPYNPYANDGGDRLRQGFERPTDAMPGYLMQLVKKRREKNNCQL